jgi:hypothetical protein
MLPFIKLYFLVQNSIPHALDIILFIIYNTKCLIHLARNKRGEEIMELGGFGPWKIIE